MLDLKLCQEENHLNQKVSKLQDKSAASSATLFKSLACKQLAIYHQEVFVSLKDKIQACNSLITHVETLTLLLKFVIRTN